MSLSRPDLDRLHAKYPDRIPVVVQPASDKEPQIDKTKFLVPRDLTMGQFGYVVRRRLQLRPDQALFFACGHVLPSCGTSIGELYTTYGEDAKYLDMVYRLENTFG